MKRLVCGMLAGLCAMMTATAAEGEMVKEAYMQEASEKVLSGKVKAANVIFEDDFSSGAESWQAGVWEQEGHRTPGALKIVDQSPEAGNHAASPPLVLDREKGYQLTGWIRTNGKVTSYSCLYLIMYDAQGNFISARESNMVKTDQWERAHIEIKPGDISPKTAHVRIVLQAAAGVAAETGTAWFDEIKLCEWEDIVPQEFLPQADEMAYTDRLFIKASSTLGPFVNPSALLVDGDRESFWWPRQDDKAPWLELSYGKFERPCRLVLRFDKAENIPDTLTVLEWNDDEDLFQNEVQIPLASVNRDIAVYSLNGLFLPTRKLKVMFPAPMSGKISELRYFIEPEVRENWNAYWIWSGDQNSTANYEEYCSRAFRRTFRIENIPQHAVIQARGDDSFQLFLNGQEIACGVELKDRLRLGNNVLGAIVTNERYAAGLLAEFDMVDSAGKEMKIISDATWKHTLLPVADNWNTLDFDDSDWKDAVITARPPFGPWGETPYHLNSRRIPLVLISENVPDKLEAGKTSELRFEFAPLEDTSKLSPLSLKITRNNEVFYEKVINENDKLGMVNVLLSLSAFLLPGDYEMELAMPFHEICFKGQVWKKQITVSNSRSASLSSAKIVIKDGLSHIEINGAIYPTIGYTFPYGAGRMTQRLMNRKFGNAGCNIAQIFALPRIVGRGNFDFTAIDRSVSDALDTNPDAFLILKVALNQLYPGFAQEYPDEICTLDNYQKVNYPSHASKIWLAVSGEMLEALLEHIQAAPYGDRIIGYFLLSGEEGQWFHHWGNADPTQEGSISDYSPAMVHYFRDFLRKKYQTDEDLQKKWHNPAVTLENAMIPKRAERIRPHHNGAFRSAEDQPAIDFGENLSDCVNHAMGHYAAIVKRKTNDRALVFAYYGHIMDVGDGYLAELSGYLKQQELLNNPDIDCFAGPLSYRSEFRDIGAPSSIDFPPSGSLRLHRKLVMQEDDLRTHLFPREYAYTIRLPWQSVSVLAREVAKTLCDGAGMYLHEFGTDTRNWFDDPEYLEEVKKLNGLRKYLVAERNLGSVSEIAVISSEHTLNFMNQKPRYIARNVPETQAIFMREAIGRMGAPFTEYLASSFLDEKMPDYKFYIFLNTYMLSNEEKEAIHRKLAKNGASALFLYAPGIIGEDSEPSIENMSDFLGMKMTAVDGWNAPLSIQFDLDSPHGKIQEASGMPAGNSLDVLYVVSDTKAKILGTLAGSSYAAFAMKRQNGSRIYFASFPFFSANVLRAVAQEADVHVYMDSDDAFYRSGEVFAVHTNKMPGERVVRFKQAAHIRQLYPDRLDFGVTDAIRFNAPEIQTRIFERISVENND